MLDVAPTELMLVAVVAIVVIGPKDLPKAMRVAGYWVGRARGVARQFRQGFDDMVREAEFAELEKSWAEENARIMREFPTTTMTATALPAAAGEVGMDDDGEPVAQTPQPELRETPDAKAQDDLPATVGQHVEHPAVVPAASDAPRTSDTAAGDGTKAPS